MHHPKAWIISSIILLFLFHGTVAVAERIELKDGTVHHGTIVMDEGGQIELETLEGKIIPIEKSEIRTLSSHGHISWVSRKKLKDMDIPFEPDEFIKYIGQGDAEIVSYFMYAGMSPNVRDEKGDPALICAVRSGRTEIVEKLIFKSREDRTGWPDLPLMEVTDVNVRSADGETALMLAARNGQTDIVKILLGVEADVDARKMNGETALMLAAKNGRADIVRLILREGADADARNADGETALTLATKKRNRKVVKLLSESVLDADAKARQREWIGKEKETFPSRIYIPLSWRDIQEGEFITEKFNVTIVRPGLKLTGYWQAEVDLTKKFSKEWSKFEEPREVPAYTIKASITIDNKQRFNCVSERVKNELGKQIGLDYEEAGFFNLAVELGENKLEEVTLIYHGGRFGGIDSIAYLEFGEEETSIILNKPFIQDRFVACWEHYIQKNLTPKLDEILQIEGICEHMNACRHDPSIDIRSGTSLLDKVYHHIDEEHRVLVLGK